MSAANGDWAMLMRRRVFSLERPAESHNSAFALIFAAL